MKYIRTKDDYVGETIYSFDIPKFENDEANALLKKLQETIEQVVIKYADTIEELCDEFVVYWDKYKSYEVLKYEDLFARTEYGNMRYDYFFNKKELVVYGAIWTERGLLYVAKMNEKGELELL